MTKIRALYLTAMIWNVLAHYPKKDKADAFEFLGIPDNISNLCPCCQYVNDLRLEILENDHCESHCPLKDFWPTGRCEGKTDYTHSVWEAWNGVYQHPRQARDFMGLPADADALEVREMAAIDIRDAAISEMEKIFRQSPLTVFDDEDGWATTKAEVDPK